MDVIYYMIKLVKLILWGRKKKESRKNRLVELLIRSGSLKVSEVNYGKSLRSENIGKSNKVRLNHKVKLISIAMLACLVSGCWAQDADNVPEALTARVAANQQVVDELISAGLLNETTGETIKKSIEDVLAKPEDISKQSITWYMRYSEECWRSSPTFNERGKINIELPEIKILGKEIYSGADFGFSGIPKIAGAKFPYSQNTGSSGKTITNEIIPMQAVTTDHVNILNETLSYNVYVLKYDEDIYGVNNANNQGGEGGTGVSEVEGKISTKDKEIALDVIEGLVTNIKNTQDEKEKVEYYRQLRQFFRDTGEKLLDPEKEPIIAPTILGNFRQYHQCAASCDRGTPEEPCPGVKVNAPEVNPSKIGYDMVLTYDGGIPIASIRFMEFNPKVVDKLIKAEGVNRDKYLVDPTNKAVYLLEYPVYYLSEVSLTDNNTKFESSIEQSDITLNIYTGELKNENGVPMKQMKDNLIHIEGAGGEGEKGTSSFIVTGLGKVNNIGHAEKEVESGAVILRDYLELMYMPNVVSGEDVITLGRRLRITNFAGDITTSIASFINKDGKIEQRIKSDVNLEDSEGYDIEDRRHNFGYDNPAHEILVTDLVDLETVGKEGSQIKLSRPIGGVVESEGKNEATEDKTGETAEENTETTGEDIETGGENKETGYATKDKIGGKLLKTIYSNSIKPTTKFPGEHVGTEDGKNKEIGQMEFYGLLTDKNPFETALYSGWINNNNMEEGNLAWWNEWLAENEFKYRIDFNKIEMSFMGNYQFDMINEGFVILNLDTISKIQREINERNLNKNITGIRTLFIILGFILISYSALLLACWTFDSVIVSGVGLLTIVTFGKWVAVRSSEELPDMDIEGKHYMDFGDILKNSIIIMGIGILLTIVDIVDLIAIIVNTFGGLGEAIDKIFFGRY